MERKKFNEPVTCPGQFSLKKLTKEEKSYSSFRNSAVTVFQNQRFSLLENEDYHVVEYHTQQVIVLPILENKSVIMPKVFRKILGGAVWELPAGGVQKNESPEEAALRELREETGISITDNSRLVQENTLVISPNRLPMFPSIFSVNISQNEFDKRSMHDDEVESVDCFSMNEIKAMMSSGEIMTSITLAILGRFILGQDFQTVNSSSI